MQFIDYYYYEYQMAPSPFCSATRFLRNSDRIIEKK